MKYRVVNSSSGNVIAEKYDAENKELYIKYKGHREYKYSGVSLTEYKSLFLEGVSFSKEMFKVVKGKTYEEI